jgi:uncharacterized protein YecE (DUF72 family)
LRPGRRAPRDFAGLFEKLERDGLQCVWEPRGGWPDAEVTALGRRLGLIHAVDPFQRPSVWGEPAYYRLHARGGVRSSCSDADLAELKARSPAWR